MSEGAPDTVAPADNHTPPPENMIGDISGEVAEAVSRRVRHYLIGLDLQRTQEEHGAFTDEELSAAHKRIFGSGTAAGSGHRHI